MKKNILFLFLFIIGASCSMAQDTIYDSQMDGPYLMPTNHFPHLLVIDCDIPQWKHQKGEFIGQYHTDTSITVYGIAFTAFLKAYHLFPDSMDIKAYLATASTPSDWQNIEFQYIDSILMSPDIYPIIKEMIQIIHGLTLTIQSSIVCFLAMNCTFPHPIKLRTHSMLSFLMTTIPS